MIEKVLAHAVSVLAAVFAAWSLHGWLALEPTARFAERVPGMDDPRGLKRLAAVEARVKIGEFFEKGDGQPADSTASWPRFRGAAFDNIAGPGTRLALDWGEKGPRVLWSVELGEGHAAPAVHNGRVYVLDYDEPRKADVLRCLSLTDGREIWRRGYAVALKRNHGMSRTVPAVTDRHVVTIGPKCHVMCVDAGSGDLRWGIDMVRDYGTTIPGWYAGQCPLIDGNCAVLAPAGSNVLMLAVDCDSGQTTWSTPNPGRWPMSHASIMPMRLDGRRTYVYCAIGATVGIAADGPEAGRILWQTKAWDPSVIAPSPLPLDDGRILLTAGYSAGSMMIRVSPAGETGFEVATLYRKSPREGLCSEQQTPLFFEGHLFAVQPKDAGDLRKQLVCYRPDGTLVWASGKAHTFGLGPYMIVGDKLLVVDDYGVLTVAEASLAGYRQLARADVLDGHDSWGPLAAVDGLVLMRDSKRMVCLDLRPAGVAAGRE